MLILTGAAGFIGANTLQRLNELGCADVICADNLTDDSKFQNLVGKRFSDYVDYRKLFKLTRKIKLNGIIHLGACSDTSSKNGVEMLAKNHEYTKRILQLAQKKHCPIVYASSASVYGRGDHGFTEEAMNGAIGGVPESLYAFSKWLVDDYVRERHSTELTVPVAGVRYFNVYGPGEQHKGRMMSLAGKLFQAALKGEKTALFVNSEKFCRDFIYIQDAVDITLFLLHNRLSGLFNAGTGNARSFADMAQIANTLTGKETYELSPMPPDMVYRYQRYTCADTTKLRSVGYAADFTSLEAGMAHYWATLKEGMTHGTT